MGEEGGGRGESERARERRREGEKEGEVETLSPTYKNASKDLRLLPFLRRMSKHDSQRHCDCKRPPQVPIPQKLLVGVWQHYVVKLLT